MKEKESIIMEIRAGAGGEEATLFVRDLFRMYNKYSADQGWHLEALEEKRSEIGGFKQVVFKLSGNDVFKKMKHEGGVHRVQRVPKTEKGNRLHTSTASVAVLKIPQEAEIKIKPKEVEMEFFKASGHGGQYVNKRETAVRLTHLPTGLVVSSQGERSLEQNKQNAFSILRAKLYEKELKEKEAVQNQERRVQIGMAQRSEKIRTYNFPQDRITDHRIKKSFHNIEKILHGDLEPIIKKLQKMLK